MQKFAYIRIIVALLIVGALVVSGLTGCAKKGNGVAVAQANTEWKLGPFEDIKGTETLYASVSTEGGEGGGSLSRRASVALPHNYLFIGLNNKNLHFLLSDHQSLLTEMTTLQMGEEKTVGGEGKSDHTAEWLYFHRVTTDTNQDKELSGNDAFSVGFANADGTNYQDVVVGIDTILREMRRGKDKYLLIYRKQKAIHIAEIDIPSRSMIVDNSLASLDLPVKK
jgi:hypothetical protein